MTVQTVAVSRAPRPTAATAAGRLAMVGAATVFLGAIHLRHRPATMCLFREVTGIPCPFCGGTTAAVHVGHGDLRGALAASPLAVVLLAAWPFLELIQSPKFWRTPWIRWTVIGSVLVFAEIWQLVRFGIISP